MIQFRLLTSAFGRRSINEVTANGGRFGAQILRIAILLSFSSKITINFVTSDMAFLDHSLAAYSVKGHKTYQTCTCSKSWFQDLYFDVFCMPLLHKIKMLSCQHLSTKNVKKKPQFVPEHLTRTGK